MDIDILIDSLTNCLEKRETNELCDTEYRLVVKTINKIKATELQHRGWRFDWSAPHRNGYDIYELLTVNDEEVQGMIALKHIRNQYYTHIDIVEAAPHNIGQKGKYKGVGAHLFAIACKLSWLVGNEGYVQFKAKTNLIEHYKETIGAQCIDSQNMYIDTYGALKLINTYFAGGL
ncbi:MAG: hypothetical protein J6Y72_10485 [Bacteroidales bacterium]|jgi:hypothetical protein|nr:hypothetical protein [Bacteroidales bacterium]MBP5420223.1 hypothetical protein [Bacteroidales bacterium]